MLGSINMSKECDKAADVLQSFIGLMSPPNTLLIQKQRCPDTWTDKGKIPKEVLDHAKGIAIFHAFRGGMYFALTSGTGIVVARLPNGEWSPPSAFSIRVGSLGIVYGVDVYDCICVLNTAEAVDAYRHSERQIDGNLSIAAGPAGGSVGTAEQSAVQTYTRSKGVYGGATVDTMTIKELSEVNAQFYGKNFTATQILAGDIEGSEGSTKRSTALKKWHDVIEATAKSG